MSVWCGTAELGRPGLLAGHGAAADVVLTSKQRCSLQAGTALYSPLLYRHSTLYTLLLPAATASACHLNWLHNITGCTSVLHHPALDIVKLANQGGELGDDGEIVLRCPL